jgi:SNF2 family DNA or RNA helicase
MQKVASIKERYKPGNLFQGSYGSVIYVPSVDLLNQLSLDPMALTERLKETKEQKKREKEEAILPPPEYDYSNLTIKVPVPPPPSDAMVNPRTKKTYPLGTKTDPDTGEDLRQIDSVMQERTIRNQIIYSDPAHGLVYFVDKTGMIDSVQLGHLVELTDNRNLILSVLDTKIPVKDHFKTTAGLKQTWSASRMEELFYVDPKDTSHEGNARRERLKSMSNVDFERDGGVPLFMYAKSADFREYVHSQLRDLESRFKSGTASVKNDMLGEYYAQLITAVLFADKHSEYFKQLISDEDKALAVDPSEAPEVPHIKPDTRFLPHQSYTLSFLKDRKVAMVDADPGAGKTLMLLADILDKMNRGLVTRPCIVMPNALLSDQKAELEEWTQGTVNFIVINTDTVKTSDPEAPRLQRGPRKGLPGEGSKSAGLQAITKLIREAPKNTVLMTSYEWLRGGQEDQVKTASGVRYRNPSWLATRVGIDMLVLDESHKVRINASGKASGQAEAILQMASLVPYKRCYSGTITPGSPDDIFLQMSFLDPSVLGSRKQFLDKYALSVTRSKKVEEFKPGAIKQIREIISRRAGVSIRRSAWLNELPDLQVHYHKATLTGPQRIVYERLLDRIIKEELLGEMEPGTVGLELQREMRNKYASNPLARDQVSKWQKPTQVALPEYDDQTGDFLEVDYDVEEDTESAVGSKFDLSDASKKEAFKRAQARIRQLWERYEAIQGETEDAPDVEDFKPLLTKFIAIDKFLNYPPADEFGQHFLAEEQDRQSPKIKVIDQILARHFSDPNSGKVIIFTHYKEVARHIAESIQFSDRAVYYEAGESKNLSRFKKDSSVQILVAVEQSIQEGQNLQMASRIIRVDLPWNPGNYEQSIARAYRLPPKDPDAPRYSTISIDLIFCEGTAELTKFARMVSKMHAVRQFISGYTSNARFRLVGMSLENMQNFNTFAAVQRHVDAFKEMRDYEREEARVAPKIFGTDTRALATGAEMPGSEKIETPFVESDLNRGPWTVKPQKMKKGIINPKLVFFNGGYWLTMEYINGMKFILDGFEKMETEGVMSRTFRTPKEGFEILANLREQGIHVVNQQELHAKVMGKIAIDPAFPQSKIDYQKLVRTASKVVLASDVPNFADEATRKQVLAYNPSQEHLKVARELLVRAARDLFNNDKDVTDLHVLAAAKVLGLFNLNPQTIDLKNFYRHTKRFTVFTQNKKILQDQLSSVIEPAAAAPAATPAAEEEGSEIPGLDVSPSPAGIPIQLDIAIIGRIRAGRLVTAPAFMIKDSSAFLAPGLIEPALKILEGQGFRRQGAAESLRWIFLGENRAQAKAKLEDFSRLVYVWYTIGNPDEYIATLRDVGFTDAEIERVFPKEEITAMVKMAHLLRKYPEYRGLTQLVFGAN